MAYDHDEIRQRQLQKRQEARRQREQKKARIRKILMLVVVALVIVGLCVLVVALVRHASAPEPESVTIETEQPLDTQPEDPETVIHIAFAGDLNVTDKTVAAGSTAQGYD